MAEIGGNWLKDGPHVDIVRTARLCHPNWEAIARITFAPQSTAPAWLVWREEVFLPVLLPGLQSIRVAGATGDRRALLAGDRTLDQRLSADMAGRSREAGQKLLHAFPAPPAEKLWRNYARQVDVGEAPGHLCTVLAVRAAAFHVAPSLLVGACVFLEARGGFGEKGVAHWMEMADDCVRASASLQTVGLRAA